MKGIQFGPHLNHNSIVSHKSSISTEKVRSKMTSNVLVLVLMVVALFATSCNSVATPTTVPVTAAAESVAIDTPAADTATSPAAESAAADADAPAAATMAKLNLNTVTGDELLATIPDFGNRMVREFDEYRPYISIQQFRQEIGKYVDEAQVAFYEEYVYVPVAINESDAATLQQIPGLDTAAADALIAARPFASTDAFLQTLADVAPAVDATVAQGYLEAD